MNKINSNKISHRINKASILKAQTINCTDFPRHKLRPLTGCCSQGPVPTKESKQALQCRHGNGFQNKIQSKIIYEIRNSLIFVSWERRRVYIHWKKYASDYISTTKIPAMRRSATFNILDVEVEHGCCAEGRLCCINDQREIPLYKYHDAPEFLHGNPFVVHGYRAMLPFTLCVKSLFTWNNDTINIWSHLIGFLFFFFLMMWDITVAMSGHHHLLDLLVMTIGLLCFQFCLLCSTGYHMFRCHSARASQRWLALDLTGISVGLLGCYLPGIHFGFYCLSVWRDIYLFIIGILFTAVFYWQTRTRYYSSNWFAGRLLLFVGMTAYGVIPAIHWVYLNDGFSSLLVQLFAPKILGVYILAISAFAFYITKFPERCFPGRFDYIGSSHQCWHMIVLVLFVWWHHSGQQLLMFRMEHPCQE